MMMIMKVYLRKNKKKKKVKMWLEIKRNKKNHIDTFYIYRIIYKDSFQKRREMFETNNLINNNIFFKKKRNPINTLTNGKELNDKNNEM